MSRNPHSPALGPVRVWNAFRAEIMKARRRKFTWLGPVLVTLAVFAVAVARKLDTQESGAYDFIAYATPMALNLLGLPILLMYCAGLVASEMDSGSIRMALVRPIRRRDLLFAKLLLGMGYAALLTLCAAGFSWMLSPLLGPLQGITIAEEPLYSAWDMARAYGLGMLLALLPQFAAAAFALMISTFTPSAGAAVGATIGLWLFVDLLKYPLGVDRILFSSYVETPWRVFIDRCNGLDPAWFPEAGYCIASSLVFMTLCMLAAWMVLARRDFRV